MIIGAGLAGLIAAHILPYDVFERAPEPEAMHKALLRFRTQEVSRITGIDFAPVKVRKGIWSVDKEEFVPPDIRLANQYSAKCLHGHLANNRSVWNLDPVTRYIAPEDFYEQLVDNLGSRVHWSSPYLFMKHPPVDPVVSTVPMDIVLRQLEVTPPGLDFDKAPIHVRRFRISNCDLYQTVYYPDPAVSVYRASITKDLLIVEETVSDSQSGLPHVAQSFGFESTDISPVESSNQRYGKIADIDPFIRKQLISHLTTEHNIFSLGRFATWRNILLDDVVDDALVIKKLLKASAYERKLHQHK